MLIKLDDDDAFLGYYGSRADQEEVEGGED